MKMSIAGLFCALSVVYGKDQHGVVLDAGSSGTRVIVFRWDTAAPLRTLTQLRHRKVKPGLSHCASSGCDNAIARSCARGAIASILDVGAEALTREEAARTSVYLRATAGLRLLPSDARTALLSGARDAIAQSGFASCTSTLDCPRMVTGEEEARFDWLSANAALFLLGGAANGTVGVLDLGGGSTQIAFATRVEPAVGRRLASGAAAATAPLYAVSRLNFGANEAYARLGEEGGGGAVCGVGRAGDFDACLAAVRAWIAESEAAGLGGLGPSPAAPPLLKPLAAELKSSGDTMPFVAFDNFAVTVGALWGDAVASGAMRGSWPRYAALTRAALPAPTLSEIATRARALCSLSWEERRASVVAPPAPNSVSDFKLAKSCFSAAYTVALLADVYGIGLDERRVAFAATLNGFEGSWALGAMAHEIITAASVSAVSCAAGGGGGDGII